MIFIIVYFIPRCMNKASPKCTMDFHLDKAKLYLNILWKDATTDLKLFFKRVSIINFYFNTNRNLQRNKYATIVDIKQAFCWIQDGKREISTNDKRHKCFCICIVSVIWRKCLGRKIPLHSEYLTCFFFLIEYTWWQLAIVCWTILSAGPTEVNYTKEMDHFFYFLKKYKIYRLVELVLLLNSVFIFT